MRSPFVLSHTVEYALRATLYVAQRRPDAVRLPEIAAEIRAPSRYLAKILGHLARSGVLTSSRGPAGGFRLAAGHRGLPLSSIIAVFERPTRRRCLLGHGVCGECSSCPVHEKWAPIAQSTADFFARTTIGDLVPPTHTP
jgi:Rrf2 family protein